ncbi:MAG: glycosyltransferase [Lachnospiraceae bacterium]|nr:glycosyltransferase [Lachnospiraceae bacterium]
MNNQLAFITYGNYGKKHLAGPKNKIDAQIKAFSFWFDKVYYFSYTFGTVFCFLNNHEIDKRQAITREDAFREIYYWIKYYKIHNVYIRFELFFDLWTVSFLKQLRTISVIALELPDYPYDTLIRNPRAVLEDEIFRKNISDCVDIIVTQAEYSKIFGIKTIRIVNGVHIDDIPEWRSRKKEKTIHLTGMACLNKWHGYERVIEGLKNYRSENKEYDIKFYIVGEGAESEKYKRLIETYNLMDDVFLVGFKKGTELEELYSITDIGVGTLAYYKINITVGSPIKTLEYCARGIPFIYGYTDRAFNGNEIYTYNVENNEDPIDMNGVIQLYERTVTDEDIHIKMRKYVEDNYTWKDILKPVYDFYCKKSNTKSDVVQRKDCES